MNIPYIQFEHSAFIRCKAIAIDLGAPKVCAQGMVLSLWDFALSLADSDADEPWKFETSDPESWLWSACDAEEIGASFAFTKARLCHALCHASLVVTVTNGVIIRGLSRYISVATKMSEAKEAARIRQRKHRKLTALATSYSDSDVTRDVTDKRNKGIKEVINYLETKEEKEQKEESFVSAKRARKPRNKKKSLDFENQNAVEVSHELKNPNATEVSTSAESLEPVEKQTAPVEEKNPDKTQTPKPQLGVDNKTFVSLPADVSATPIHDNKKEPHIYHATIIRCSEVFTKVRGSKYRATSRDYKTIKDLLSDSDTTPDEIVRRFEVGLRLVYGPISSIHGLDGKWNACDGIENKKPKDIARGHADVSDWSAEPRFEGELKTF